MKASLLADLKIIMLGLWGFALQSVKAWLRAGKAERELEG